MTLHTITLLLLIATCGLSQLQGTLARLTRLFYGFCVHLALCTQSSRQQLHLWTLIWSQPLQRPLLLLLLQAAWSLAAHSGKLISAQVVNTP